jgi:hypothetical protein
MLSPKEQNIEYHRGRMRGTKTRGNEICFGSYFTGLRTNLDYITSN